ncbi:MAG: diguanylate cyclase [Gammaproteobacteria bacterium]|nr:diguanylate cyclase [Gammaproteobacteria bacterium]
MKSRLAFFNNISSFIGTSDTNVAFIIIKIRRFKEINTTYGFKKGDEYLEYVEDKLQAVLRPDDLVGRIGDNRITTITEQYFSRPACGKQDRFRVQTPCRYRRFDDIPQAGDGSFGKARPWHNIR